MASARVHQARLTSSSTCSVATGSRYTRKVGVAKPRYRGRQRARGCAHRVAPHHPAQGSCGPPARCAVGRPRRSGARRHRRDTCSSSTPRRGDEGRPGSPAPPGVAAHRTGTLERQHRASVDRLSSAGVAELMIRARWLPRRRSRPANAKDIALTWSHSPGVDARLQGKPGTLACAPASAA